MPFKGNWFFSHDHWVGFLLPVSDPMKLTVVPSQTGLGPFNIKLATGLRFTSMYCCKTSESGPFTRSFTVFSPGVVYTTR